MKKITYKFCSISSYEIEEKTEYVTTFLNKTLSCHTDEEYERNIQLAQQEAYNGEYTVEEVEDPVAEPTADDVLNALLGVM